MSSLFALEEAWTWKRALVSATARKVAEIVGFVTGASSPQRPCTRCPVAQLRGNATPWKRIARLDQITADGRILRVALGPGPRSVIGNRVVGETPANPVTDDSRLRAHPVARLDLSTRGEVRVAEAARF